MSTVQQNIQPQIPQKSNRNLYIAIGVVAFLGITYLLISTITNKITAGSASATGDGDTGDGNSGTPDQTNNPNRTNNPDNPNNSVTISPTTPSATTTTITTPPVIKQSNVSIVNYFPDPGVKPYIQGESRSITGGSDRTYYINFPTPFVTSIGGEEVLDLKPVVMIDCINSMHTDQYIFIPIITEISGTRFGYKYYYMNLGSPAFLNDCPDNHTLNWTAYGFVTTSDYIDIPSIQYKSMLPNIVTPVPTPTFYTHNVFSINFDQPFVSIPSVNLSCINSINIDSFVYYPMLTQVTKTGFKYRYFKLNINAPTVTNPCSDNHTIKYTAMGNITSSFDRAYLRWGTSQILASTGSTIDMNGPFIESSVVKINSVLVTPDTTKILYPMIKNIGPQVDTSKFTYKNFSFSVNAPSACKNASIDHQLNWVWVDNNE